MLICVDIEPADVLVTVTVTTAVLAVWAAGGKKRRERQCDRCGKANGG